MPELSDGQFQGLKPGFLSTMPNFRSAMTNKLLRRTPSLPNIPDPALLSMYRTGVYSHPGFGDIAEEERPHAVKQELRNRNVLAEFSEKENPTDIAVRGPAKKQIDLPKPDWIR